MSFHLIQGNVCYFQANARGNNTRAILSSDFSQINYGCFRTYSNQKVARCLFSKDDEAKKASVPSSKHWSKQNLPLIDTPQQKNIPSTDEVKKIFEGRILGRGSFGTVVKGIYKSK